MIYPKITKFDGKTVQTERGPFTIDKVIYMDGGTSPRLTLEEIRTIWLRFVLTYADLAGQTREELTALAQPEGQLDGGQWFRHAMSEGYA